MTSNGGESRTGRALVLSGSIGRGHDVVAEVCAAALGKAGLEARTRDCMELLGRFNALFADKLYRLLVSRPGVYDGFHFAQLRAGGRFTKRGGRAASRRLVRALENDLADPSLELVLSVFATGAGVGDELAARRAGLRHVVFCTDATVHAMWVHERTDLFVATCDLAAETIRRYRPSAEIQVIPAPVRPAFYDAPSQKEARAALGIPDDASCVLLVAGGWGIAPLADSAAELAERGYEVLAVAGSNDRLKRQLDTVAARHPLVHPFAFTDEMPSLISASDVVVSGPGQTCHEVRAVGRLLVLLDAVPGHGRENLLHELMVGGAASCSPAGESVARAVEAALKSGSRPAPWPIRSEKEWEDVFIRSLVPLGLDLRNH